MALSVDVKWEQRNTKLEELVTLRVNACAFFLKEKCEGDLSVADTSIFHYIVGQNPSEAPFSPTLSVYSSLMWV